MASIAENLKRLRKAAGMSQDKLAELSGVSQQLISQIEGGKNATTKELPALATAMRVNVAEIDENYVAVDGGGDLKVVRVATADDSKVLLSYKFVGEPDPSDEELLDLLAKATPQERAEFLMLLRLRRGRATP